MTNDLNAIVERFAELVAERAAEKIARRLGDRAATPRTGPVFTGLVRPPGRSRRSFNERCKSGVVLGAYQEGRLWVAPQDAWFASFARAPRLPTAVAPANDDDTSIVAEIISRAGLRLTGGAR